MRCQRSLRPTSPSESQTATSSSFSAHLSFPAVFLTHPFLSLLHPSSLRYAAEINAEPDSIHVIRKGSVAPELSKALRISDWPVWSSKTGGWPLIDHPYEFTHESKELSLFLEGKVTVTPEGGEPVELGPGDYAVFPKGLVSTWVIAEPIKKRYYEFKK